MTAKRLLLGAIALVFLVGAALQVIPPGHRRYRADSMVIAKPYTNALLARSFEAQVVRTIPDVLRLWVAPGLSAIPGSGAPVVTNSVAIRIYAVGLTPQDAQRAANDAATQLCRTVLTNYGITGEIADRANTARRYSFFNDSFQPAVARLFRH